MVNTIPKAFFAYPSRSPTLKEAIDVAVPELNKKGQVKIKTWEECNIGGKFVIDTICNAINEAELFFADLTGLNANVMFELGYAVARDKRIWLIFDETYTEEKKMFDQLKVLTTIGYISCCNSVDIVSGFYKDRPFEDIENTIFQTAIEPNLKPRGYHSILYLKSQHENQAAVNMSNLLQTRLPKKIISDTPREPVAQTLANYGELVLSCNGLICHFMNPKRDGAYLQAARHALICGMAHGFEKPLLMLAEGDFLSPIDYRDFLKHYNTASEALGYLEGWLPRVEQDLQVNQEATVAPRLKIFITYAHQDTEAQKQLKTHLAVMERTGKIKVWDDNKILPGDEWFKDISNNLANADILLYLVSARSLTSENCNKELGEALRAKTRVIPIILESCDWLNHQLSDFQALPDKSLPINQWDYENDGWQNVVDGIRKIVDKMQSQTDSPPGTSEDDLRAELAFQRGNLFIMIGQIDRAIEVYSHAIALNPDYADAYNNRGAAYRNKGEYDRAIEDCTEAIDLNPGYAAAYNNRGGAYNDKGDYNLAIEDCTKAIDLNPGYADAHFNRGNAYQSKGDYDRAIEDYNTAIDLNRGYADAHLNRGNAYQSKDDYDRAIEDYNTAIQLKPDSADAYNNRGVVYSDKGEYDRAIEDYNTAIQLKSDSAAAYLNRGNTYERKGEYDRAIEDYNTAIDLNRGYADAHLNRGRVYQSKGDYNRAIEDYTKAIGLKPDFAIAYNNRGMAFLSNNAVHQAIEDYTTAMRLNPKLTLPYYNRGAAYLLLEEWEQAKTDLITAKAKGIDIITMFRGNYGSVPYFEQRSGAQLPADLAAMLTPQQ